MKSFSKKGQIGNLAPAVLSLVLAATILVFGLIMSQELRDTRIGTVAGEVVNETLSTFLGTVNVSVAANSSCGFGSINTTIAIWNGTYGEATGTGNYTAYPNGNIVNLTQLDGNDKISYNYTWGDEACVSANNTVTGLGTFADFWEIIVLAIVISVVIGLLLIVFGGRGRAR